MLLLKRFLGSNKLNENDSKILGIWSSQVVAGAGVKFSTDRIRGNIKEIEFDGVWHILSRKNKVWVIKASDGTTKKNIAWVIGKRNSNTVKELYDKLKHLRECIFYTNHLGCHF